VAATIRAATIADLPAIVELEEEAFDPSWSQATLSKAIGDERTVVVVAEVDGAISGYGTAWCIGDEAELTRLAVFERSRRQGLGGRLLKALLTDCAKLGAARVFLEVRSSNVAAFKMYHNAGFIRIGERKRYYANGEDAVVMSFDVVP